MLSAAHWSPDELIGEPMGPDRQKDVTESDMPQAIEVIGTVVLFHIEVRSTLPGNVLKIDRFFAQLCRGRNIKKMQIAQT